MTILKLLNLVNNVKHIYRIDKNKNVNMYLSVVIKNILYIFAIVVDDAVYIDIVMDVFFSNRKFVSRVSY